MKFDDKWFFNLMRRWLRTALTISIICLLVYVSVQQALRQSANDPQIQMAEDAAAEMAKGSGPEEVLPSETIDISKSLASYVIIYDAGGIPVAGSGTLEGKLPTLPEGVFDFAKNNGKDKITWQPRPGVRSAIVVVHYQGENPGYVMAGRSLREVEVRTSQLQLITALAWLAGLFATLIISAI